MNTRRVREITVCKYGKLQSPTGQVQAQAHIKRSTSRLLNTTLIILKIKAVVTDRISMHARLLKKNIT